MRRSPGLAELKDPASAHHERCDGSGHHRRLRGDVAGIVACVLAATDLYVGLTAERAERRAFAPAAAAAELRPLEAQGLLSRATTAVRAAAGQGDAGGRVHRRAEHPGGLSSREVEVLALPARGLTKRQIADRLVISPRTADDHIQHMCTKIGVATRAAAALWAMQDELVGS